MEKFYSNSEEKYLKAVLLYAVPAVGGNNFGLFYDAEGTQPAHESDYDWKDLFLKGLIRVALLSHEEYTTYNPECINNPNQIVTTIGLGVGAYDARFFPDESEDQIPLDPGEAGKL